MLLCYNDHMTKIICTECKKEIHSRKELAVVGRSFKPYHKECFKNAKGIYTFYSGYPINGNFTWILIALINIALWSTYLVFHAEFIETLYMSLFATVLFLGFRLISYFFYEIKLPKE